MDIKIKAKLKAYTKGVIPTFEAGKGIDVDNSKEGVYIISARQEDLTQEEFEDLKDRDLIQDDTTYFVVESSTSNSANQNTEEAEE